MAFQEIKPLDVPKLDDMNYLHQRVGYVGGSKDLIDLWFSLD